MTVLESGGRVARVENHDEAYHVWRAAGVRQRPLVHIDAHHDMWWLDERGTLSIANYICPALKEDLVSEIFWVVPAETWERPSSRRAVRRHLERIRKEYPTSAKHLTTAAGQISTVVLDKRLTVCPVESLPRSGAPVLLDLDVDYLVIPFVTGFGLDMHASTPWRWPEQLLNDLHNRGVRSDLVTIAYSVEGGYTPLKWKYLGDELAARLIYDDGKSQSSIAGFDCMRLGALAITGGDVPTAVGSYAEAARLLPESAAPFYHLAHAHAGCGRLEQARTCYRESLLRDPTYRTAFNNDGLWHYWDQRYREAEQEFRRTLALDPEDAYAHFGLALLARIHKQWSQAERCARSAVEHNPQCVDAYRLLGEALSQQRRYDEAIAAYDHSLKLTLAGRRPLAANLLTAHTGDRLIDPGHFWIFSRVARLHGLMGRSAEAIANYRLSFAARCDDARAHGDAMRQYLKRHEWRHGLHELRQAVTAVPGEIRSWLYRTRKSLRLLLRQTRRLLFAS